jgi:hypothetical protein
MWSGHNAHDFRLRKCRTVPVHYRRNIKGNESGLHRVGPLRPRSSSLAITGPIGEPAKETHKRRSNATRTGEKREEREREREEKEIGQASERHGEEAGRT